MAKFGDLNKTLNLFYGSDVAEDYAYLINVQKNSPMETMKMVALIDRFGEYNLININDWYTESVEKGENINSDTITEYIKNYYDFSQLILFGSIEEIQNYIQEQELKVSQLSLKGEGYTRAYNNLEMGAGIEFNGGIAFDNIDVLISAVNNSNAI